MNTGREKLPCLTRSLPGCHLKTINRCVLSGEEGPSLRQGCPTAAGDNDRDDVDDDEGEDDDDDDERLNNNNKGGGGGIKAKEKRKKKERMKTNVQH